MELYLTLDNSKGSIIIPRGFRPETIRNNPGGFRQKQFGKIPTRDYKTRLPFRIIQRRVKRHKITNMFEAATKPCDLEGN